MQKLIFAVRDITADVFAAPFVSQNRNTAMRDFGHACQDVQSQLSKSPEDYQLFFLGTFDDDLGSIAGVKPELVANATQFVKE